uniref:ATP synthase subunit a n=1 Tax=Teredorus bashanensis TaxID=2936563 RepID=A0A8T9VQB5_9ORTH|nr:ATP synthase F0 subunit 6 [Teredorus bashanensis]YP_010697727.1 ATP synthase F0 subunit 6 [Teredorus anhuiensis]UPH84308.1 ATP synthase F0 subunit 6 [Teredorus bashanensis]WCF76525.1 ATP synthase F0 subunit 6 [Teredorus anhuiensis]
MMTNLFSNFDPSTSLMLPINWMSMWMFMLVIPSTFWLIKTRPYIIMNNISKKLNQEFSMISNNSKSTLIFISMFMLITTNNFMGLFPYIFTSTAHMCVTLSIAMPMWMGINIFGWTKKTNHMFEHLVPMGTPPILMPFMVCIETISSLIRPCTLAIRLAANMIAGHLLLTLLGNTGSMINELLLMTMLSVQMMLLILESAVAIIQSYVFSVLTTLYFSEIN